MKKINSSAPGRICLFGEHQDYMNFPIIAAAIDLEIKIEGIVLPGGKIELDLLNLNDHIKFSLNEIKYTQERDYLKSTINVLKKKNLFENIEIKGFIKGNIPIQSGVSSSSALVVAWVGFLLAASNNYQKLSENKQAIAEIAYLAEVEEFQESGGRMDHYTSTLGGILYIDFYQSIKTFSLPSHLKEFVLGDSLQPKNTQQTLKRIRTGQEQAFIELAKHLKFKDNFHLKYEEVSPHLKKISPGLRPYLKAALLNHRITDMAKEELLKEKPDLEKIAIFMNEHHKILRDNLKISTAKIETMIKMAINAGALAAKINGSGEGGCMLAYCPGKQEQVAEAIKKAGGIPYIINIGRGLKVESNNI